MGISIGIVGLPNVGKSTLFNALTKKGVPAANYPFCTIDPSVGVVAVPDERLALLTNFSKSSKTVPAAIEFVDIAGLVKGASEGQGLGNAFLSHIREVTAIAEVVRIFEDTDILHVEGGVNPLRDIEIINLELVLSDLQTVTKRRANIKSDIKKGDKKAVIEEGVLARLETALENGNLASTVIPTEEEIPMVKQLNLLTTKKILYVLNKKTGAKNLDEINDERYQKLLTFFKEQGAMFVTVDARIEDELKEMVGEEKETFRKEFGSHDDGINTLIKGGYELLDLISYFTTGEDETRAWTIPKGSTAPEAGTAIHTDFKEKFIRAEVIHYTKLLEAGSYAKARELGQVRIEGKEYIVQDGDVMEFRV